LGIEMTHYSGEYDQYINSKSSENLRVTFLRILSLKVGSKLSILHYGSFWISYFNIFIVQKQQQQQQQKPIEEEMPQEEKCHIHGNVYVAMNQDSGTYLCNSCIYVS
jgi:hypothetical protein